jgi:hypothetical protein
LRHDNYHSWDMITTKVGHDNYQSWDMTTTKVETWQLARVRHDNYQGWDIFTIKGKTYLLSKVRHNYYQWETMHILMMRHDIKVETCQLQKLRLDNYNGWDLITTKVETW